MIKPELNILSLGGVCASCMAAKPRAEKDMRIIEGLFNYTESFK